MPKFDKLNLPTGFSPLLRNVPYSFNDDLTLLEYCQTMYKYLEETNQLTNSMIEYLNKFIIEFDEKLHETVMDVLGEWVESGLFEDIIIESLFGGFRRFREEFELLLKQNEVQTKNLLNKYKKDMDDKLNAIGTMGTIKYVQSVGGLPSTSTNLHVVLDDGHFYYYQNGKWNKGNEFISPTVYPIVQKTGEAYNLNTNDDWKKNPNITSLKTGEYTGYIQTKGRPSDLPSKTPYPDPAYPVAENFPDELKGQMCFVTVIESISERAVFQVRAVGSGKIYETNMQQDGSLNAWYSLVRVNDDNPIQLSRLTYSDGTALSWKRGVDSGDQLISEDLLISIFKLKIGFYVASINRWADVVKANNSIQLPKEDPRNLPKDLPQGQVFSLSNAVSPTGRASLVLTAMYTGACWYAFTGIGNEPLNWFRLDRTERTDEEEMALVADKVINNDLENKNFTMSVITDTHDMKGSGTTQTGFLNPYHIDNFNMLGDMLNGYLDSENHLGDYIDGNLSISVGIRNMMSSTSKFYTKPNRYGILGNHDYNGVWSGKYFENFKKPSQYLTKNQMKRYQPKGVDDTYYYVDHTNKKVRQIFLNVFEHSYMVGTDGKFIRDPHNQQSVSGKQIAWLNQTLMSVPTDYDVVFTAHNVPNGVFSTVEDYYNGDMLLSLIIGYQNKTKGSIFVSGTDESESDYSFYHIESEFDFTNTKGKVLGYLMGHRHEDITIMRGGVRFISILCSRPSGNGEPQKPLRPYHDVNEDALSVFSFDKTKGTISMFRYGAGSDKVFNMYK